MSKKQFCYFTVEMVHKTFPLLHKYSRRLAELEGLLEELEAVKRSEVVSILDRMMRLSGKL